MKVKPEEILQQHKFCFICGAKLIRKAENLLVCGNCEYRKYINPTPCNGAILENEKGEILLVRRKADPKKGYWDLPGGFVDLNETAEESMERELEEELGVKIKNLSYLTSKFDQYTYSGIDFPTLELIFKGKAPNEKLTPTSDITEVKFFPKNKLPFGKIAFESLEEVLHEYIK